MKKILAILIIALLAMCMFVSCDSDSDEDETNYVNLTYIFYDDNTFEATIEGKITVNDNLYVGGIFSINGTYVGNDTSGTFTYLDEDDYECYGSYQVSGDQVYIVDDGDEAFLNRYGSGSGIVGTWKAKLTY